MKVLITGGAGFIGSHLVDHHRKQGDDVVVIDDLSTGHAGNIAHHLKTAGFTFHQEDLQNWEGLAACVRDVDLIYHMAAVVGVHHVLEDPLHVINVNQAATHRLLGSMVEQKSSARVIVASSSEVYGFDAHVAFKETDDLVIPGENPLRWCYAVTKLADEHLAFAYHYKHKLNVITARLFNTIGPRQSDRYGMVVPRLLNQALNGEVLTVFGDGTQSRSFCDVRDTVEGLSRLIKNKEAIGKIVNVGNNVEIMIDELAQRILTFTGSSLDIEYQPYEKAYLIDFRDITHRCPDLALFNELTGYKPRWTLEETLATMMAEKEKRA